MRWYSIGGALGEEALQDLKEQLQESFAQLHDAWTTAGTYPAEASVSIPAYLFS
jgi:hypothetical protein